MISNIWVMKVMSRRLPRNIRTLLNSSKYLWMTFKEKIMIERRPQVMLKNGPRGHNITLIWLVLLHKRKHIHQRTLILISHLTSRGIMPSVLTNMTIKMKINGKMKQQNEFQAGKLSQTKVLKNSGKTQLPKPREKLLFQKPQKV